MIKHNSSAVDITMSPSYKPPSRKGGPKPLSRKRVFVEKRRKKREKAAALENNSTSKNQNGISKGKDAILTAQNGKIEEKCEGDIHHSNGIYSFPLYSPNSEKENTLFETSPDINLHLEENNSTENVQLSSGTDDEIPSSGYWNDPLEIVNCKKKKEMSSTITAYEQEENAFSTMIYFEEDDKSLNHSAPSDDSSKVTCNNKEYEIYEEIECIEIEISEDVKIQKKNIVGNCTVDLEYLIESLLRLTYDEEGRHEASCTRKRWEIKKSSQEGLQTFVTLFCRSCDASVVQRSHPNDSDNSHNLKL